jgi:alkylation response protein AidB-like acyl-CoA dehydrogenase
LIVEKRRSLRLARWNQNGYRAPIEILFQDCPVPKENLLGEEGKGFRIAMASLDYGRPTIAAQAVGLAQGAMEKAIRYAKERSSLETDR